MAQTTGERNPNFQTSERAISGGAYAKRVGRAGRAGGFAMFFARKARSATSGALEPRDRVWFTNPRGRSFAVSRLRRPSAVSVAGRASSPVPVGCLSLSGDNKRRLHAPFLFVYNSTGAYFIHFQFVRESVEHDIGGISMQCKNRLRLRNLVSPVPEGSFCHARARNPPVRGRPLGEAISLRSRKSQTKK